jgi:hypothetical protein
VSAWHGETHLVQIDFLQCGSHEPFEQRFLDLLARGSALAAK